MPEMASARFAAKRALPAAGSTAWLRIFLMVPAARRLGEEREQRVDEACRDGHAAPALEVGRPRDARVGPVHDASVEDLPRRGDRGDVRAADDLLRHGKRVRIAEGVVAARDLLDGRRRALAREDRDLEPFPFPESTRDTREDPRVRVAVEEVGPERHRDQRRRVLLRAAGSAATTATTVPRHNARTAFRGRSTRILALPPDRSEPYCVSIQCHTIVPKAMATVKRGGPESLTFRRWRCSIDSVVRATIYHGPGDVRVEDVPDASLQEPTDAVVRIT